ncbi:hypothetical protein NDU88_007235 [Pleurodeles waltl]|uniref:Peptidoglycan binding-like domain-containing protein n=1 Tax=Pleurodeles waltl TaxID=8319 RepID=A0AAV7WGH8_PLEWA|nr:hypothetical protein NDU88_007235 [Pleurodeles waltl]
MKHWGMYSIGRYLRKYGWIEPVKWDSLRYQIPSMPATEEKTPADITVLLTEGQSEATDLEATDPPDLILNPNFVNALKRFQEANGLPVTGTLDEATQKTMNSSRCGVPDHKVPAASEEHYILKSNNSNNSNISEPYEHANIINVENTTQVNTSAQQNGTNSSASDMGLPPEGSFLNRLLAQVRKKRSDSIRSAAQRVGFSKPTVKWRLLGEGYSVQLPLNEQRNILKLAFRIWSEVVPLDFEEDLRSPAHTIDIKLGFGTRE